MILVVSVIPMMVGIAEIGRHGFFVPAFRSQLCNETGEEEAVPST